VVSSSLTLNSTILCERFRFRKFEALVDDRGVIFKITANFGQIIPAGFELRLPFLSRSQFSKD